MNPAPPAPIDTVIVDDEPLARQIVRDLLAADPEIRVVGECTGSGAQAELLRARPELIFLDIQMPEVSGFDLLGAIGASGPAALPVVVFVTAYDQYALRAFQVHAADYLLKPFDDERFAAAVAHAKQQVRSRKPPQAAQLAALLHELAGRSGRRPADRAYRDRFLVRTGDHAVLVRVPDIDWIEAADYYAQLHVGGASYLIREPLSELEEELDPALFFRIHRSAIVNIDRVVEIHGYSQGSALVVLRDGTRLTLSRQRREVFERLLGRVR
jgi:two-component system LytT family response regulator